MGNAGQIHGLDVSALMAALDGPAVFALALLDDARPSATPLFFARGGTPEQPILWWASSPRSGHAQASGEGPVLAAGATWDEPRGIETLRGVQMRGNVRRADTLPAPLASRGRALYLARHPAAAPHLPAGASDPQLFALALTRAKLTDNARLGMGTHEVWTFAGEFETMDRALP